MPTDPNMTGLIYPDEDGDEDIWDTILNSTVFPIIGAHDHTTGKGVRIPSAALNVNADISASSSGNNYSLIDLKAIDFAPVAASTITGYSSALFVNSSDSNNLYFRNASGTNVKLTDGSTLNVSIVGGIGGDYSSIGALFDYDDATDQFRARQELSASTRQYAKLRIADLQLAEYLAAGNPTAPTNFITIKSPAALAASYTLTLPGSLPASSAFRMIGATGTETFSTGPTVTGEITAADFNYTTAQDIEIPGCLWQDPNGSHTKLLGAAGMQLGFTLAASANKLTLPIVLRAGDQVTGWTVYVKKNTSNANTITAQMYKCDGILGTETAVGTTATDSQNAPTFITLSKTGLSQNVIASDQFFIIFTPGAGIVPAADLLLHAVVSVKRP